MDVSKTALIRLLRGAINGSNTWGDVGTKVKELLITNVVDPVEKAGEQFATDFGKAALTEAGNDVVTLLPQVLADPTSIGTIIGGAIPGIASRLEQQAIAIGEKDALLGANAIIGNALRTQLTAAVIASTQDPHVAVPDHVADAVSVALQNAGASATVATA